MRNNLLKKLNKFKPPHSSSSSSSPASWQTFPWWLPSVGPAHSGSPKDIVTSILQLQLH